MMRHIQRHKRYIWILAAAVCMMQTLPLHLHLHHDTADHVDGIVHTADLHLATSPDDRAHHDDAHVIDLDANSILKSLDADALVPLLLFCLLLTLVFTPLVRRPHYFPAPAGTSARPRYLEFAPLRAPPHA
jgi:hypothetical protein